MARDLRITWTLAACTALALFGDATMYAVLPSQYGVLGLRAISVGWLLSVNRLVRPPLNYVSGWLGDRLGHRTPYILGVAVGVISTAGYGLVRGLWPLLALRALWGVAWALIAVSAYAMILDVAAENRRGRLAGLYGSFAFFGGAFGPVLGGWLVDAYGFRTAMLVLGGCTAVGCLLAMTLPNTGARRPRAASGSGAPLSTPQGLPARIRLRAFREALAQSDRRLWLIAGLNMAHRFFFAGVFMATLGRYLLDNHGQQVSVQGALVGVASLTGSLLFLQNLVTVLVGPALGYLSDRLRDRPTLLAVGQVFGALGLLAFVLGRGLPAVVLGVLAVATAYGLVPPLLVAWMGDLTGPRGRGQLVGTFQTMGDIGSGVAPILAYPLLEFLGVRSLYAASATCVAATIPLILMSRGAAQAVPLETKRRTGPVACPPTPSDE